MDGITIRFRSTEYQCIKKAAGENDLQGLRDLKSWCLKNADDKLMKKKCAIIKDADETKDEFDRYIVNIVGTCNKDKTGAITFVPKKVDNCWS
jgi:hypothetical protein